MVKDIAPPPGITQPTLRMDNERRPGFVLDLLALMPAGKATVTIGGRPFLSINSDEKTLEVEVDGAREAGLRLSDLVQLQEGSTGVLKGSRRTTEALSQLGWKLTLCSEGDRILTMGSGVSRLTGRIRVDPLKLKKLLEALR
jgi:hypothetical protein